ncbi:MAG: PadR family transcriptional regulator [Gemmatimonadota bacterium]
MTSSQPPADSTGPLSALDFHVLLVLAGENLYGYGIMKAVEDHSGGLVTPEIGTLYRVLARLMDAGCVREIPSVPGEEGTHRGRPRRYYGITAQGLELVRAEVRRLRRVVALAEATIPEVVG